MREQVHTDVAIWWHIRQHYSSIVDADLISAPGEVTRERLEMNDVNFLLGWDAVSAHMEEFDEASQHDRGHSDRMRELLRDPDLHVWPSGLLQDLCNDKGTYLKLVADSGIVPVAPTEVFDCRKSSSGDFARWATSAAKENGWKKYIAKPSPSSWSRGVETFEVEEETEEEDAPKSSSADADGATTTRLLKEYYEENRGARHIVLQPHLVGLENKPETRCFYFGDTFLYAVANYSVEDGIAQVTHHPEAASSTSLAERILPDEHWHSHKKLGHTVISECLSPKLDDDVPCLIRLDFGVHSGRDLLNAGDDEEDVVFLNEIEIVPTLYLDTKFDHDRDFVAEYSASFVKAATVATGTFFSDLDQIIATAKLTLR